MSKKLENKLLTAFFTSKEFYGILIYLFIGALALSYGSNYITAFYGILSSKLFLCIFFFPSVLVFTILIYRNYLQKSILIGRMSSRQKLFNFQLRLIIKSSVAFYFFVLLLIGIVLNLKTPLNFEIMTDHFLPISNIDLLIIILLKLFLTVIVMQLINLALIQRIPNTNVVGGLLFIFILFLFASSSIENGNWYNYLLPSPYIYTIELFRTVPFNILAALLYHFTIFVIGFIFLKRTIMKLDFIGGRVS